MISYIEEWTDEESDLDPENEEDRENLVNIVELPIEELSPKSSWFTKTKNYIYVLTKEYHLPPHKD